MAESPEMQVFKQLRALFNEAVARSRGTESEPLFVRAARATEAWTTSPGRGFTAEHVESLRDEFRAALQSIRIYCENTRDYGAQANFYRLVDEMNALLNPPPQEEKPLPPPPPGRTQRPRGGGHIEL